MSAVQVQCGISCAALIAPASCVAVTCCAFFVWCGSECMSACATTQVWHGGFSGGVFSELEASKLGISRLCYAVQRTQNISRIMKGVIGSNWRERLVVVVATQASNSDATRQLLACDDPAKVALPRTFLSLLVMPRCQLW